MGENEQDYKDKMLELIQLEYNAMREEINSAHSHIYTTMQISLAVVGAILTMLYNFKDNLVIVHLLLLILLPWVSACAVLTILAESQRLKRAGDYICFLEEKVKLLWKPSDTLSQYEKVWKRKQKVVEKWLRIKHTNINLSGPLCFERWIRCLEKEEGSYGRSNIIFILRFALIYIVIPAVSIVASRLIYWDNAMIDIFYDVAIKKLPCVDIILFSILGYFSIKICMENRVAYQIQKEYMDE